MTRVSGSDVWIISYNGGVSSYSSYGGSNVITSPTWSNHVRPVFYLRASERIVSGSGTLDDPYILS